MDVINTFCNVALFILMEDCAKALRIVSLCTASVCFIVLPTVFDQYEKIAEKSIEDSIKSELSGDFERVMLAVGESSLWFRFSFPSNK